MLVPEALWLLARRRRASELAAVGAVALAGVALLPLAVHQAGNHAADFIGRISLAKRVAQVPKQFLVGFDAPLETLIAALALALAVAGLLLLTRAGEQERRGARRAAGIALPALLLPFVLAVAGVDYLITRNLIGAWVPALAVLAAGLAAPRARVAGAVLTSLLCVLLLVETIGVEANPAYQRGDWRGAARALGPLRGSRALVVSPVAGGLALQFYTQGLHPYPDAAYATTEIDAVAVAERRQGQTPAPPRPARPAPPPPGFAFAGEARSDTFTIVRYRAPRPTPLPPPALGALELAPGLADLVLQLPPGPLRGPLLPPSGAFGG